MCGIFGVLSGKSLHNIDKAKKYTNFLYDATISSSLRGLDGAGVFGVKREGNVDVIKRPIAAWDFAGMNKVQSLYHGMDNYSALIGHVRSQTRGSANFSNTHPFNHGTVVLVHNGTLNNVTSMGQTWKYGTDSEHIAKAMSEADDPDKVLSKISGAFALVWYDSRMDSMFMARNNERELHYAECVEDNTVIIASEWKMLEWLAYRNKLNIKDVFEVEAGTYIQMPRNNPNKVVIRKFVMYKEPPVIYAPLGQPYYARNEPIVEGNWEFTKEPAELNRLGYAVGQDIEFQQLSVYLSRARSKAGVVEGMSYEAPYSHVRALGIDIRKVFNPSNHSLKGKLVGVLNSKGVYPILIVNDVLVKTNAPRVIVSSARTIIKDVSLFAKSLHTQAVEVVKEETSANLKLKTILGPAGKFISTTDWTFLTKHGCGFCSGDIDVHDAAKITWLQETPVCIKCTEQMNEGNRSIN